MSKIEELLTRLDKVTGKAPQWRSRCPAHGSRSNSLSIKQTSDGTILIHCFAGCGGSEVMDAIGMTLADLYPDRGPGWRDEQNKKRTIADREKEFFYKEFTYLVQIKELEAKLKAKRHA